MPPLNLYARVRIPRTNLHTRPRVQRAPGFPCALCSLKRVEGDARLVTQDSGASRRENADTHPHRCLTIESETIRLAGPAPAAAQLSKCTPIRFSLRQITRQGR